MLGLTAIFVIPAELLGAYVVRNVSGAALFEMARRQFKREWGSTQEEIEKEIKRREAAL